MTRLICEEIFMYILYEHTLNPEDRKEQKAFLYLVKLTYLHDHCH